MLSATDKLHKLYSTTWEPLVWARSIGLEVINELDVVKAAIMGQAGSSDARGKQGRGSTAWNVTARGIEVLASVADSARMIGGGIGGAVASKLGEVLRK